MRSLLERATRIERATICLEGRTKAAVVFARMVTFGIRTRCFVELRHVWAS